MTTRLEDLRHIVADESVNISTRQTAAEKLIDEIVDAVEMPADDNQEVLELMKAWDLDELLKLSFRAHAPVDGMPLKDARESVHKKNRLRVVLVIVCDTTAHKLERLAGCEWVLSNHPREFWTRNNYNAAKLLAEVLPVTAYKIVGTGEKVPVSRPPLTIHDVWQ